MFLHAPGVPFLYFIETAHCVVAKERGAFLQQEFSALLPTEQKLFS